jgi:hypothetical protein
MQGRIKRQNQFWSCLCGGRSNCGYFFFVLGVELEIPTRPAPRKNITKGSDTEDVGEMMKKVIIVTTLKSNLYIFPSSRNYSEISINSLQFNNASHSFVIAMGYLCKSRTNRVTITSIGTTM